MGPPFHPSPWKHCVEQEVVVVGREGLSLLELQWLNTATFLSLHHPWSNTPLHRLRTWLSLCESLWLLKVFATGYQGH